MYMQKNQTSIIDPATVINNQLIRSIGIDKYSTIQSTFWEKDISKDTDGFQKLFNSFYVVRRNSEWRKDYYTLFESLKKENKTVTFEQILKALYNTTGKIEASYSSKMLATLNPNMPIWDQYVLKNAGVAQPSQGSDRFDSTVSVYSQLCEWYQCYLKTENSKECIRHFDKTFPKYKEISDIKKIDFYLWMKRD